MTNATYRILGQIVDSNTRSGVADLRLEAWDSDLLFDDFVGAAMSDTNGRFRIEFDETRFQECFSDQRPDLFFKIFRGETLIKSTADSVLWNVDAGETALVIEVDLPATEIPKGEEALLVHGQIRRPDGTPFAVVTVRAFDKDLRSEELLGEALSDAQGGYEIRYSADQFSRAEKRSADLIIRAYTEQGALLGESDILFNAGPKACVDLSIEPPQAPKLSEYEQLTAALAPVLQDLPPSELTSEDINFLLNELNDIAAVDETKLTLLAQSARFAEETTLPIEFFYGLSRIFELAPSPSASPGDFLAREPEEIKKGLESAISQHIIPDSFADLIDAILARLGQLLLELDLYEHRTFRGRLIEEKTKKPLAGLGVQIIFPASDRFNDENRETTDRQGRFSFMYAAPKDADVSVQLTLTAQDEQNSESYSTKIVLSPDQTDVVTLEIPEASLPKLPKTTISALKQDLNLDLPDDFIDALTALNIESLEDIRSRAGIRPEDLPDNEDFSAAAMLNAYAHLGVLSSDLKVNHALIEQGFTAIHAIATRPREEFVRQMHEAVGYRKAAEIHVAAGAQNMYLNNLLIGYGANPKSFRYKADWSRPITTLTGYDLTPDWFKVKCKCRDCDSAVSPLAYLADLLRYATLNLWDSRNAVSLDDLVARFYQPFAELPTSCDQVDKRIRRIRICIEVLRAHLETRTPISYRQTALHKAEKQYLMNAYRILLEQIGTSFDELRAAQGDEKQAESLAARLGIAPITDDSSFSDLLRQLTLGPDNNKVQLGEISEAALEGLFGLRVTKNRAPLEEPSESPEFLSWRRQFLYRLWLTQDHPAEPTSTQGPSAKHSAGKPPLIDPDLIGLADIANPVSDDPVYQLWEQRSNGIDEMLSTMRRERVAVGLSELIESPDFGLGVPLATILKWQEELEEGKDIKRKIEEIGLTLSAFRRVLKITSLDSSTILESDWEELYSIIVQAQKQALYESWGKEESDLTLSPQYFRLSDSEAELPRWRATWKQRRDWQQKLEARIDQENALLGQLHEAIDSTEKAVLTQLRDALIEATGKTAETLSAQLQIDCKIGVCDKTTRVAQAITTVQGLLAGVRTGQLTKVFPDLQLLAPNFDEEWKWLGSYATWRAAVFVLMYPENTLYPHLKRNQTPAFRQLVKTLRYNRRMTRDDACRAANSYAEYFNDITSLKLETSVIADAVHREQECSAAAVAVPRVFLFARGGVTNTIYFSSYRQDDKSPYAQTFWTPLSDITNVIDVCGASVYEQPSGAHHIYLFAIKGDKNTQKLVFVKYDLRQGRWIGEPVELDLPEDAVEFQAVVKQRNWEDKPPHLIIRVPSGALYERRLNSDGTSWEDAEWKMIVNSAKGRQFKSLHAMVGMAKHYYVFMNTGDNNQPKQLVYRLFGYNDDGKWRNISNGNAFHGVVPWLVHQLVFVFHGNSQTRLSDTNTRLEYQDIFLLDDFDSWLVDVTGLSLSNVPVSDKTILDILEAAITYDKLSRMVKKEVIEAQKAREEDSNSSRNEVAELQETIRLEKARKAAKEALKRAEEIIQGLEEKIANDQNPYWDEWRFANETVKLFTEPKQDLKTVLGQLLIYQIVQFNTRGPSWPLDQKISHSGIVGLDRIIFASGLAVTGANDRIAYQKGNKTQTSRYRANIDLLPIRNMLRTTTDHILLAPVLDTILLLTEQRSSTDRQSLRLSIKRAYEINRNLNAPSSVMAYLQEAWYFVPVHIALQLQRGRQFIAALDWLRTVYDYSQPNKSERNIYYPLDLDAEPAEYLARADDWLLDPLNPHEIAASRPGAYVRFTLLAIIRCFNEYADAEFARDTPESVPRAHDLYKTALQLLTHEQLDVQKEICLELIRKVIGPLEDRFFDLGLKNLSDRLEKKLSAINDYLLLSDVFKEIEPYLRLDLAPVIQYENTIKLIDKVLEDQSKVPQLGDIVAQQPGRLQVAHSALIARPEISQAITGAGNFATSELIHSMDIVSKLHSLSEAEVFPLIFTDGRSDSTNGIQPIMGDAGSFDLSAVSYGIDLMESIRLFSPMFLPFPAYEFCVPANPVLDMLRLSAEWNLYKIHTCRNISGLMRELDPYAAPTNPAVGMPTLNEAGQITAGEPVAPPPTPYRYEFLIERAKQLADRAAQMEAALLAAIEKQNAEAYHLQKARQDLGLARAGVRLQSLRVVEAKDGVQLARLQRQHAQIRVDQYQGWLDEGINELEYLSLGFMQSAAYLNSVAGGTYLLAAGTISIKSIFTFGVENIENFASALSSYANAASTQASIFSTLASYERREQDWKFQSKLAQQDVRIGSQQITLANDRVNIVEQENQISESQADFAEDTVEFLTNKFTNVELYDWMSNTLEKIYDYFLQQSTAIAALAEAQLAFQRQKPAAGIIQSDYWNLDDTLIEAIDGDVPNRRGLTGSARLLEDIYKLDQYRFETEQRKLQLSKTLSLASLGPAEFQKFRETGVLPFKTIMEIFDHDFPGHYLRLIKRVKTSVIALIPPVQGIHATLTTTDPSSVTVENRAIFRTISVKRPPETVALTSPREATGLFELQPQLQEQLLPFENMGVAAEWTFEMPKASNQFDYSTIADVLLTIEYTALDSFTYRQQIINEIDRSFSAERPFSFRHQFADQWYDLHNPDRTNTPMVVKFKTRREDFPPNIEDLKIQQVLLYFARKDGLDEEISVTLTFKLPGQDDNDNPFGGDANTIDGRISTRRANAGSWLGMQRQSPVGEWTLDLSEAKEHFEKELIEDVLLVITYTGLTPEWPS